MDEEGPRSLSAPRRPERLTRLLITPRQYVALLKCGKLNFLREFVSKPTVTGAIAPSSSFLARTMVEGLELSKAGAVLEYGPGTGVFTEYIRREMNPHSKFAAIEINPRFAEIFKARHPRVRLFQDSVTNVRAICDSAGIWSVDCIVSGLPWAA